MAKINFDYKQFLLQKGEKVGLWTCVGLGVLMLGYSLFMPGKGFLSGSPNSNADALDKASAEKENLISTNRPSGELAEAVIDPRLTGTVKQVQTLVASNYSLPNAFYTGSVVDDGRRNEPVILGPDPSSIVAMAVLAQLSTYKFLNNGEKIGIITDPVVPKIKKEREKKKQDQLGRGRFQGGFPGMGGMPGAGLGGAGLGGGGMGAGGMGPGGMPGGMGLRGMPPGMGGMGAGMGAMGGGRGGMGFAGGAPGLTKTPAPGPSGSKVVTFVKVDELDKHQNAIIAEDVLPTRAIEIVAAFPLREQYKEVQRALHLSSLQEVFNEVKFEGFDVQRRVLLADRKTPATDWAPVDVKAKYLWHLGHGGKRTEPEDPELLPLLNPWSRGLTMGRLAQQETLHESPQGAQEATKLSRYPQIETKLPLIAKSLEELKKAGQQEVPKGPPITNTDNIDPYDNIGGEATPGGKGMQNPEAGMMTKGTRPPTSGKATGGPGGEGVIGEKGTFSQKFEIPEFALIRFFDFDVELGSIYEYRFRVRMKNPNEGRKDVAYPEVAEKKVLVSPWVTVPDPKPLPEEVQYFAIDLKNVDWKYKDKDGNEKPVASRFRGAPEADTNKNEAVVHIQRWLSSTNLTGKATQPIEATVGDWVVGARIRVYRGEYLGHSDKQKVVVWSSTDEDFILAADPTRRGSDKSIIDVSFAAENAPEDAILVDMGGGRLTYKRISALPKDEDEKPETKTVTDQAPTELLIMTPEGRLVVRDSAADMENTEARDRYVKWFERLQEIENKAAKDAGKGAGKGGDAFGAGGKGGS
jgi:hypothetical protein